MTNRLIFSGFDKGTIKIDFPFLYETFPDSVNLDPSIMEGALPNPLLGSALSPHSLSCTHGQCPGCAVNSLYRRVMEGGRDQSGEAQVHTPVWPCLVQ